MQYIIDIRPDQDLQFLLTFLEKMQVVYRPFALVPPKNSKKVEKNRAVAPSVLKRSEKYYGKLSAETADALHKYVEESRNEWERTF